MDFTAREAGAEWFDANIPCMIGCPVLTNAGRYVAAISEGDDLLSYLTARLPNPFPSICGRVCAAPCELRCRRGLIDEPIAIRALKRHACERFGVESEDNRWNELLAPAPAERSERVAVVGAGPAGLACAHDLRRYGFQVTVFDAADRPGGMMVLGIPEYRLRRDVLDAEIQSILDMGVDLRLGRTLGEDFTISSLKDDGYAAVFVAIGAMRSRDLAIPGRDLDGVFRAVEFLLNFNQGFSVDLGERVLVIGGGNVAMDAARTAIRAEYAGAEPIPPDLSYSGVEAAAMAELDAARAALRAGAREVTIVALESPEEMPAASFEIEEAEEEGIRFLHRLGPKAIEGNGRVTGLRTLDVASVFDPDGRFNPRFVEGTGKVIDCDSVILAIGQATDLICVRPEDGIEVTPRGTIGVDRETLATSGARVYAGGDVAFGPRSLIDAVADGRRAAASILREFGNGEAVETSSRTMLHRPLPIRPVSYDRTSRVPVPSLPTNRRVGLTEVELGYSEHQAREEAGRCLECFRNIHLETSLCILCGGCVDVCPTGVLRILPAADLGVEDEGLALVLQEDFCIRCGLCVERCPTDALEMREWVGTGVVVATA